MNRRRNQILLNTLFWVAYFLYEWLTNAAFSPDFKQHFVIASIIVPVTFLASLFTVHVLIRQYYFKGKRTAFWIGLIVSMTFFVCVRRILNFYITYPLYYPEYQSIPIFFPAKVIIELVNLYLIVGFYAMFYFVRAWYEQQSLVQTLEQKKTEAELQLLKAQVQPHFIFNTLNNIYSYAVLKNEKTPELIHGLSAFLSYNLYDSKLKHILLCKEVEYIRSYVALERLRHGARLDVSINIFNSIDGFYISPLLLLPLVENCFKHGPAMTLSDHWIRIDISTENEWATIKIENSVREAAAKTSDKNGLGLDNVKKRLHIIYPSTHEFKVICEKDSFMVVMKIKSLSDES